MYVAYFTLTIRNKRNEGNLKLKKKFKIAANGAIV